LLDSVCLLKKNTAWHSLVIALSRLTGTAWYYRYYCAASNHVCRVSN